MTTLLYIAAIVAGLASLILLDTPRRTSGCVPRSDGRRSTSGNVRPPRGGSGQSRRAP